MIAPRFTPASALEAQDDLARFWQSPTGRSFMRGWIEARVNTGYPTWGMEASARANLEVRTLLGARTYLITQDMLTLAEHAAHSMPDQPLLLSDLPCPVGFLIFERAIPIPDAHGKKIALAAFAWNRRMAKVGLDPDNEYPGRDMLDGVCWTYYGDTLDQRDEYMQELGPDHIRRVTRLSLFGEDFEGFGKGIHDPDVIAKRFDSDVESVKTTLFWMHKFPLAMWSLMGQTLSTVSEQRPDRPVRRRLERAGSPLAVNTIRVVTLRRLKPDSHTDDAPGTVDWSHRWIVSGHWRNVWHPSVQTNRLQWIAPFVKGPADKPLVIKRTVHRLAR